MAFMNDDDAVFDWMDRHGLTERSGPENPFDPVGEDPDPAAHYASAVLPVALSPLMVVLVDMTNLIIDGKMLPEAREKLREIHGALFKIVQDAAS